MRNLIAFIAGGLMFVGLFLLLLFGGMLDTPGAPIGPAVCMGVAAISTMGAGAALANLYERGRI